jgi:hypothetical protein
MKPVQLTVNISQKINMGNFESKGIVIGASVSLEESEDLQEAKTELCQKLKQFLDYEIKQLKGASK